MGKARFSGGNVPQPQILRELGTHPISPPRGLLTPAPHSTSTRLQFYGPY